MTARWQSACTTRRRCSGREPSPACRAPAAKRRWPRVRQAGLDAEQLRKEQQLLLDYARMAVTEENVGLLAKQALAARSAVAASTLAEEYPRDFARIIGLLFAVAAPGLRYHPYRKLGRTGRHYEKQPFHRQSSLLNALYLLKLVKESKQYF